MSKLVIRNYSRMKIIIMELLTGIIVHVCMCVCCCYLYVFDCHCLHHITAVMMKEIQSN